MTKETAFNLGYRESYIRLQKTKRGRAKLQEKYSYIERD